ncbi:MAG: glucose-1-phosphate cytidylyltransferase [Dehalococcoidia bacterium]|nr:glucose-1-phosphate cytidylyltransferase [Dehalococcoidia bacterium]
MKTIILCGGRGMRLQEETEFRPKPLIPIGGRPILWHIMKTYAHYGFREFVLCLGYRGEMIKDYFLNYEAMSSDFTIRLGHQYSLNYNDAHREQDFVVTLAETGLETMTGGRIKQVERYVEGDTFMVTYGDGVADIDIEALVEYHQQHGRLATVTAVHPVSRFGMLTLDDNSAVLNFTEKPQIEGWVNAGFFVFSRKVFDYLAGDDCFLEQEPLERLAREGELMAYKHHGSFYAMDTYRDYKFLNELWDREQTPWKKWE